MKFVLNCFASLRLTVICLLISMVLVFLSTLAQVQWGIYEAMERYFATWFVWFDLGQTGISLPFLPGGYLVGGVLIINLLCAHWKRFRLGWNKVGLFAIHIGILVLLVGGFVTHWMAHEGQLRFSEGESKQFYESFLDRELVVVERLPGQEVRETVIPSDFVRKGEVLTHENWPFALRVDKFYANTRITLRRAMGGTGNHAVTHGWGKRLNVEPVKQTFKPDEQNLLTAYLTPVWNKQDVGTWMVTNALAELQWFSVEGRSFGIAMRRTRYYMPFELTLLDFRHDRYPGTEIAKNFSSNVQLINESTNEDREVLIYMNHPLRYDGKTFFQAGFDDNDTTSIFQVVENPGWLLPYVSCALVSIGLLWHFMLHLVRYLNRRKAS